ncbi:hypothetical protein F5Y05DRAFT_134157 [Hypoxylon sp. FL0543]|nr:hypothetical protein F5Y05DRAFT_134157 [Hypoxylon sp. FL0543]
MPKSLGGTAQVRGNEPLDITRLASHSDPSIPLVSVFSSATWRHGQQHGAPRPRPSLQVYYIAPDANDPAYLELAARTLEANILSGRHEGRDPAECDRLDVYGMPLLGSEEDVVNACIEHQRREIAARSEDKDWYIQRYDVARGAWRRALVIVRRGLEEWVAEDGARREVGLSVVFFDAADKGEGSGTRSDSWERRAGNLEEEEVLVRELKAELNWQHGASQFE